jgi:hypothetical protein
MFDFILSTATIFVVAIECFAPTVHVVAKLLGA